MKCSDYSNQLDSLQKLADKPVAEHLNEVEQFRMKCITAINNAKGNRKDRDSLNHESGMSQAINIIMGLE